MLGTKPSSPRSQLPNLSVLSSTINKKRVLLSAASFVFCLRIMIASFVTFRLPVIVVAISNLDMLLWYAEGQSNKVFQPMATERVPIVAATLISSFDPPDRLLSVDAADTTRWDCQYEENTDDYYCFKYAYHLQISLPPSIVGVFLCVVDLSTIESPDPLRELCIPHCLMYDELTGDYCNECGLTPSNEVVYDCRNVFHRTGEDNVTANVSTCLAKNTRGECTNSPTEPSYIGWVCNKGAATGTGYLCTRRSYAVPIPNPAFDQSNASVVPNSYTTLLCANDIGGMTVADCELPLCRILLYVSTDSYGLGMVRGGYLLCESCEVLPKNASYSFAYDCAKTFPEMPCPIRDASGTCLDPEPEQIPPTNDSASIREQFELDSNTTSTSAWRWTVIRLQPTTFNVISDIFAYFTRFAIGMAIASLYPLLMTLRLRRGQAIPLEELGQMPSDFVTSLKHVFNISGPMVLLAILLAFADFSHSVADMGLDFETGTQEGQPMPVLVLGPGKRNSHRPIQLSGDPLNVRTNAVSKLSFLGIDVDKGRTQDVLVNAYVAATILIARGGSPFVSNVPIAERVTLQNAVLANVSGFVASFVPGDHPIAYMAKEIPLDCSDVAMAVVDQISSGDRYVDTSVENIAWVPNCTLSGMRSSGIFGSDSWTLAHHHPRILENAYIKLDATNSDIFLRNGTEVFQVFQATAEDKRLARDREDWTQGRAMSSVDGIVIGNLTIDLGAVVFATGCRVFGSFLSPGGVDERGEYGLIGEIPLECPPRPSGLPLTNDLECIAIVTVECAIFREDIVAHVHEVYGPLTESTECELSGLRLVWGRDLVADSELVTVVAGLYGIVRPMIWDDGDRRFQENGILAAIFALGTVEERPSIETVVRASVNITYVLFMLLPVFFTFVIVLLMHQSYRFCLVVPKSPWELMVQAKGSSLIPEAPCPEEEFPVVDKNLVYGLYFDNEQGKVMLGITHKSSIGEIQEKTLADTSQDQEASLSTEEPEAADALHDPSGSTGTTQDTSQDQEASLSTQEPEAADTQQDPSGSTGITQDKGPKECSIDGKRDESKRIHEFERDESARVDNTPNTCAKEQETARMLKQRRCPRPSDDGQIAVPVRKNRILL